MKVLLNKKIAKSSDLRKNFLYISKIPIVEIEALAEIH